MTFVFQIEMGLFGSGLLVGVIQVRVDTRKRQLHVALKVQTFLNMYHNEDRRLENLARSGRGEVHLLNSRIDHSW